MKTLAILLALTLPALGQVFNDKEVASPSANLKVGKLIQRQDISTTQHPIELLSFGEFKSSARVGINVATGDVTFTTANADAAAVVFWDSLLKLEKVGKVIKAKGEDLSIGASRFGDIKNGGVISTSPKSVILAGKKTWINVNLVTGRVTWRKGMVPSEASRVFWDAVVLRFAAVKASTE